ncbi:glycosyltransferase [Maribacter confluentis]|uniref:Glycosyltransferase n=1 Tax=Maribacter confluentis TaxID=1656093 RepID=A0ABT8RTR3_9FLAO|nr:glycosyltransferase [Maribacter confluentis]MDO1514310.1 glycosyltransferase [Maribacter confluentis]
MNLKPTIHFINNIAPHYMEPMIYQLLKSEEFNLFFSCGENQNLGIKTVDFSTEKYKPYKNHIDVNIKNIWIKSKYLVWQKGVISKCMLKKKPDLIVLLGEFLIISNWIGAIICRLRGIPVAFRGHGLYGNEGTIKRFIRVLFYKLANSQLVYERRSKGLLINNGLKPSTIHVLFNSLTYDYHKSQREQLKNLSKEEVFPFFKSTKIPTLVFTGRLTKIKRLDTLLTTVKRLQQEIELNLLIIGDGTEREDLENLAQNILKDGTYHFYGSCYDENIMGRLLSKSDLCVSPGNVGLTAIHSLSYGTPVCTHMNYANQMPEAEAIENGMNGCLFEENNLDDMYLQIKTWLIKHPLKTDEIAINCYKIIDEYYNPYFQEKVFLKLAQQNAPIV